jgi:hypothetical protein
MKLEQTFALMESLRRSISGPILEWFQSMDRSGPRHGVGLFLLEKTGILREGLRDLVASGALLLGEIL